MVKTATIMKLGRLLYYLKMSSIGEPAAAASSAVVVVDDGTIHFFTAAAAAKEPVQ